MSKACSEHQSKVASNHKVDARAHKPPPLQIPKHAKLDTTNMRRSPKSVSPHASINGVYEVLEGQKPTDKMPLKAIHSSESDNLVSPIVEGNRDQGKQNSDEAAVTDNSASAKASNGTSGLTKTSGSGKINDRADCVERGNSMCRASTSSDVSDESTCSSLSSSASKPHKGNDLRWEAIRVIRNKDGILGLNHFRLLKRLGCGDIGSVYLSELSGTRCYFAMKVMDKNSLASRKKLLRAQTEREILQSLDHPFLPTLYTHFETEKFSCLVMEFCPGGDLHTLRQRQPGKHFSEQAVKYVSICNPFFNLLVVLRSSLVWILYA